MLGTILLGVTVGLGVGFCLLTLKGLWQWQGWWRWAMAAPLLMVVGVVVNIVIEIWLNPTTHNLWPFELLMWFTLALVAVALLYFLRWVSQRYWKRNLPEKA